MQRKKIIHRDLKPSNILLYSANDGIYDIRIADFGLSISTDDLEAEYENNPEFVCGTPGYMSPECLNYFGYSPLSDIFSAGCILYNLLT
jgi:serine/threonine-protein kinase